MAAMLTSKKIAIIADTHVGDRIQQLEPTLMSALQNEKPDQILHAGDVSTPEVIEQLESLAPTLAVQGNRDWFLGYKLPKEVEFDLRRQDRPYAWTLQHLALVLELCAPFPFPKNYGSHFFPKETRQRLP